MPTLGKSSEFCPQLTGARGQSHNIIQKWIYPESNHPRVITFPHWGVRAENVVKFCLVAIFVSLEFVLDKKFSALQFLGVVLMIHQGLSNL